MRTVDITTEFQANDSWCWAAVGAIVYDKLTGERPSQCELAARLTKRTCCVDSGPCERAQSLAKLLRLLGCLRGGRPRRGRVSMETIRKEIDERGLPVPVRIAGGGLGSGHSLLIFGFDSTTSRDYLVVFDPRRGERMIEIGEFPDEHIAGTRWTHTYLLREPA